MSRPPRSPKPGGHIDDLALAGVGHRLGGGAGAVEGAGQVHRHCGFPFVIGDFPDGLEDIVGYHSGVVDEDIHAAKAGHGGGDEGVGVIGTGDIGGDGDGVAAGGADLIAGGLNGAGAAAGDDQAGAGTGQGADHLQAQAGAAAGDDHDPAVQVKAFKHRKRFLLRRFLLRANAGVG